MGRAKLFCLFDNDGCVVQIMHRCAHHIRTVPGNGLIVANGGEAALDRVLARGAWTPVERFGGSGAWQAGAADEQGAFDVLHAGHVTSLRQAREQSDVLVVALNSDDSVRRLKGDDRPVFPLEQRMEVMAALECVDLVTWFEERTAHEVIRATHPTIYVKGGDYDVDTLPETALVRTWGGRAVAIPFVHDRSTTDLLARVRSLRS